MASPIKDKAAEAYAKGKFAKAAELYAAYCSKEPGDHQSLVRLGYAWTRAGRVPEAVSAYRQAAEGFAKAGFLPRAIAASKLILELDPGHADVQEMLADLYARKEGSAPTPHTGNTRSSAPVSRSPPLAASRRMSPSVTAPRPVVPPAPEA